MTPFREACRKKLLDMVVCPRCGRVNLPHASVQVDLDERCEWANCAQCGHDGPLVKFLPGRVA
jgi:transcription elongation factor Elf1